jgi:hypothetical protein
MPPLAVIAGGAALGIGASAIKSSSAAGSAKKAGQAAKGGQKDKLAYLQEREALPMGLREGALQQLGGLYGLPGGTGSQEEFIAQARQSPLYSAMMGSREAGEEAILRNQAMTGGLRSGSTQEALYDYNTQLENQALLEAYNQRVQGLSGFTGLTDRTSEIGQTMADIGAVEAGQQQAVGQAKLGGWSGGLGAIQGAYGQAVKGGII